MDEKSLGWVFIVTRHTPEHNWPYDSDAMDSEIQRVGGQRMRRDDSSSPIRSHRSIIVQREGFGFSKVLDCVISRDEGAHGWSSMSSLPNTQISHIVSNTFHSDIMMSRVR